MCLLGQVAACSSEGLDMAARILKGERGSYGQGLAQLRAYGYTDAVQNRYYHDFLKQCLAAAVCFTAVLLLVWIFTAYKKMLWCAAAQTYMEQQAQHLQETWYFQYVLRIQRSGNPYAGNVQADVPCFSFQARAAQQKSSCTKSVCQEKNRKNSCHMHQCFYFVHRGFSSPFASIVAVKKREINPFLVLFSLGIACIHRQYSLEI